MLRWFRMAFVYKSSITQSEALDRIWKLPALPEADRMRVKPMPREKPRLVKGQRRA
jgi:hypothetical protein